MLTVKKKNKTTKTQQKKAHNDLCWINRHDSKIERKITKCLLVYIFWHTFQANT